MMNGNLKIIENLNSLLAYELTAIRAPLFICSETQLLR
jgi:bacterioferritin (cytochrome b1)